MCMQCAHSARTVQGFPHSQFDLAPISPPPCILGIPETAGVMQPLLIPFPFFGWRFPCETRVPSVRLHHPPAGNTVQEGDLWADGGEQVLWPRNSFGLSLDGCRGLFRSTKVLALVGVTSHTTVPRGYTGGTKMQNVQTGNRWIVS